ncbi:hypothetical protein CHGG_09583 [Chaetomium globosum CBS 148.51]|uniref:Uncharacterized protein n=1 Tax=Chaetomium globosum (strain ATCC 6205 / CBS 148.51 / DSM 1962 / NBRC 6347 / NRRL 1970) TaxID=306901 RepID=Q2GR21_CHAGB|nr:uncharacterized protein CHGG_09583 [Chaetomium globosum CBS 148.51]EAQ83179.1 hypothetical protein CHGG_09583 [Chaetomium globosum CBS 148.51]
MAPASKRSPDTEGMELENESLPQSSITVAADATVPPTSSLESETESAPSSPAATAQPAEQVDRPSIPFRASKDSDGLEASGNGHMMPPVATRPSGRDYHHEYEFSDLDEITVRQLNEDILAYRYDLDYCRAQLEEADLTPQETRTLQLRTLDLGHQIRHCTHRIETIKAQSRKRTTFRPTYNTSGAISYSVHGANGSGKQPHAVANGQGAAMVPARLMSATPAHAAAKRPTPDEDHGSAKRVKASSPGLDLMGGVMEDGVNTALQRLGFWKCRLCSAPKYLLAGAGRSPAAPCKWPLKDISKMITHFTEMHSEHTPAERCVELGSALAQNRGPFEYWLRRTRAQNISDGSIIDDCFDTLLDGDMPDLLRRHSRAAAGMPMS